MIEVAKIDVVIVSGGDGGTNEFIVGKGINSFVDIRGKAMVVRSAAHRSRAPTDVSFSADYSLAPGDPMIAQVGTEKDGYLFLALTDLSEDDQGRLIGAIGAAVACPKPAAGGVALKPNLSGCETESLEVVRRAAVLTLQDRTLLTEVAWIAPGAP